FSGGLARGRDVRLDELFLVHGRPPLPGSFGRVFNHRSIVDGLYRADLPTTKSGAGVSPMAAARVQDLTEMPNHWHKVRVVKQTATAASSDSDTDGERADVAGGVGLGAGARDGFPPGSHTGAV